MSDFKGFAQKMADEYYVMYGVKAPPHLMQMYEKLEFLLQWAYEKGRSVDLLNEELPSNPEWKLTV